MNGRALFICLLLLASTLAFGQVTTYGPPGLTTTIPMATAGPPQVTPPAATIPTTSSTNQLGTSTVVTTIPIVSAVPPPIEPSPSERMASGLRYAYTSNTETPQPAAGALFNPGVTGNRTVEDDMHGRSMGEVAREKRHCNPEVTGRIFTNDDFERIPSGDASMPTLVKNVCNE